MTSDRTRGALADEQYRQILDTAPDAMLVIDQDERISFANLQTEKLFGYPRAELLGKPLELLIPERFRGAHATHVTRYFSKPVGRSMGSGIELFGRRADGTEMAIEVSLSPVRTADGLLVSAAIRDISERRRMEAAAKLSADRLVSAVESIQDAFALFNAEDRLILCNSVYRSMLQDSAHGPLVGKSYEDVLDAWLETLTFASDADRSQFRATRLASRGNPTSAFDVRTKDGRSLRVMDRRTAEGGLVKTIWDLTDDVRTAEELREARALAEAGSAAKSDFLSSMSHELRTPLNAILGFAQLLQRDKKQPLSDRHRERVGQILTGGEHLLRLIDDVLDLSRIEVGKISISTEPVNVGSVLEEVRTTLEPLAARSRISIETLPLEGAPHVFADRTRLVQILMNFGSNAIKYNRPSGSVTFSVSLPDAGHLRLTVTDTGLGIAADKQDKLFQPFQRAGQETGPIEGTGIGLVITKRLAELMGGRVGYQSVAGVGSDFWVEIPVHTVAEHAEPVPPDRLAELPSVPKADGRSLVLYVEDNPANVLFMRDLLGDFEGIDLVTAPTAEMGIELARAQPPEVIIMDINLPGMSGFDALGVLQSWPETRAIPVIALTAAASEHDRRRGEAAGFHRYLTKPIQVDELHTTLSSLLGNAS